MHHKLSSQDLDIATIAARRGWSTVEADHARDNRDTSYGDECIITLANGRAIHCPAYPGECDYVRVVDCGHELAYWVSDDWKDAPTEVMGALLGCARAAQH